MFANALLHLIIILLSSQLSIVVCPGLTDGFSVHTSKKCLIVLILKQISNVMHMVTEFAPNIDIL